MMLAGLPVPDHAVEDLAELVRAAGADDLADRLERAAADKVALLALTIDERAIILAALLTLQRAEAAATSAEAAAANAELAAGRGARS